MRVREDWLVDGVSYRQLDYWVRSGWLHPYEPHPGSGHEREWPVRELRIAAEMGGLVRLGLIPAAAARVARAGLADRVARLLEYAARTEAVRVPSQEPS